MRRFIFTGICILLLATYAGAQDQLSVKQQADKLYERYEYFKSLNLYLKLAKKDKSDIKVLERIADCYRNINRYDDALEWYARVVDYPNANKINHYYYAEALLRSQKFEEAKQQYRLFYTDNTAGLKLKLSSCDSAALWMKQKPVYHVKNAAGLNTEYSDWGLTLIGKAGLIFTSDRQINDENIDNRTGNSWFKLYSVNTGSNEVSELPLKIDDNFEYHIGPIALNRTADTAYITLTTGLPKKKLAIDKRDTKRGQRLYSRRLQLVMASKQDNRWVVFDRFPYNNIQKYSVSNAALSKDGRLIYFTSDMPGGEGKTDIWYCEKRPDGTWGNPVNCGKTINTKEEESFPTIGGDGALYYASKGLPGMGGYDIYKAKGEKAQWNTPENLKYPINTTSDDFYFVTNDGINGYLSSNREGGKGSDDIYGFSFSPPDTTTSKRIAKVQPPVVTPVVKTNTPPVTPVIKTKPPTVTSIVKVNPPAVTPVVKVNPPAVTPVVKINPPANSGFVLNNIYYDLDKSNIRPDAAVELDKLAETLKQHPHLKIEISSYTDSRASAKYNLALSKRRAKAVVTYMFRQGIPVNRFKVNFYGKTHLLNECTDGVNCTEEQHQLNRRTEFKVIK